MRLIERALEQVFIAPRIEKTGSLGGRAEAFSSEETAVRASILPGGGELSAREKGLSTGEVLQLLVPADTQVKCGDGVRMRGEMYIVSSVRRWAGHLELRCTARA